MERVGLEASLSKRLQMAVGDLAGPKIPFQSSQKAWPEGCSLRPGA